MNGSSCLDDHKERFDLWLRTLTDLSESAGIDFNMLLSFTFLLKSSDSNGIDSIEFK